MAGGRLQATLRAATPRLRRSASLSLGGEPHHDQGMPGFIRSQYTVDARLFKDPDQWPIIAPWRKRRRRPERIGVLVVNLGTPDSPSYFAVQRYLREFLGDRRVIDTSRFIWLPILYGFMLPFRPIRTVRKYRKIWMQGGSPLAVYSQRLAGKIERASCASRDWEIGCGSRSA